MWTDEVVEEDEHGNEVVGRSERGEPLFGFVPCLELFVKTLNKIVGDIVVEAFYTDMFHPMQHLDRHLIGKVTVADDSTRRA